MKEFRFSPDKPFFYERSVGPFMEEGVARKASPHHIHNRLELYYLEEGECNYFIGGKSYAVREGDLVIIPKGVVHCTSYLGESRIRTVINCTSNYVPAKVMPQLPSMIPLYRNASTRDEIRRILREIGADYEAHDTFSDEAVLSRMHLLFYLIARSLPSAETVVTRTLSTSQVIDYIGAHYPEPLSLSAVAERFSLSPEYLSRLFKKECGIGFSEFLTATRLSAARDRLLGDPALSVTEVAFLCGYSDSNYFSTCFKREFGMSPKKFRGAQIA